MHNLRRQLARVYPLHLESAQYVCPDCGGVDSCDVAQCTRKAVPRTEARDIEAYFLASCDEMEKAEEKGK